MATKVSKLDKINEKVEEVSKACNYRYVTKNQRGQWGTKPWNYVKGFRVLEDDKDPNKFFLTKLYDRGKVSPITHGSQGAIVKKLNALKEGCETKWDIFDKYCDWLGGEPIDTWGYPEANRKCKFLDEKNRPDPKIARFQQPDNQSSYRHKAGAIVKVEVVTEDSRPSGFYAYKYLGDGGSDGSIRMIEIDEKTFKEWYNFQDADIRDDWDEEKEIDTGERIATRNKIQIGRSFSFDKAEGRRAIITSFYPSYNTSHGFSNARKRSQKVTQILEAYDDAIGGSPDKVYTDVRKLLKDAYPTASDWIAFDDAKFRRDYLRESPLEEGIELSKSVRSVGGVLSNINYWDREYDARKKFPDAKIWSDIDKATEAVNKAKGILKSDRHHSGEMRELNKIISDQDGAYDVFLQTLRDELSEDDDE